MATYLFGIIAVVSYRFDPADFAVSVFYHGFLSTVIHYVSNLLLESN